MLDVKAVLQQGVAFLVELPTQGWDLQAEEEGEEVSSPRTKSLELEEHVRTCSFWEEKRAAYTIHFI